jgi:Tol biopolymer transport system component
MPLIWFDRKGTPTGQVATPVNAESLSLSPDGQQVAVDNAGPANNRSSDIWVIDLTRGALLKLTADAGFTGSPIWDPHGSRIVFGAIRAGRVVSKLYQKRADGVGVEDLLLPGNSNDVDVPQDWSSDGRYIVFLRFRFDATLANDVWFLPLFGDRKPSLLLHTSFQKVQSQLSPDGRYLAYATNESDTYQIVVQSFPDPTRGRWHITAQGGTEPSWRRDNRELYYLAPDGKLMAVEVESNPTFKFGKPTPLFQTTLTQQQPVPASRRYVNADGQRFLMISTPTVTASDPNTTPITASINWSAALQK